MFLLLQNFHGGSPTSSTANRFKPRKEQTIWRDTVMCCCMHSWHLFPVQTRTFVVSAHHTQQYTNSHDTIILMIARELVHQCKGVCACEYAALYFDMAAVLPSLHALNRMLLCRFEDLLVQEGGCAPRTRAFQAQARIQTQIMMAMRGTKGTRGMTVSSLLSRECHLMNCASILVLKHLPSGQFIL